MNARARMVVGIGVSAALLIGAGITAWWQWREYAMSGNPRVLVVAPAVEESVQPTPVAVTPPIRRPQQAKAPEIVKAPEVVKAPEIVKAPVVVKAPAVVVAPAPVIAPAPPVEPEFTDYKALAPERAVVINLDRTWYVMRWADAPVQQAESIAQEYVKDRMVFTVNNPERMMLWGTNLNLPVDMGRYSTVAIRYKSDANMARRPWYHVWIDNGTGPAGGGFTPWGLPDVKGDDKEHEARFDIAKIKKQGICTNFRVSTCPAGKAGKYELIAMWFETPADAKAEALGDDKPAMFTVTDRQGAAVEGATVTVDGERVNFARSKKTDAEGNVTITPLMNEAHRHFVEVDAEGYGKLPPAPFQAGLDRPMALKISHAAPYGGVVLNEEGKPIEKAQIDFIGYAGEGVERLALFTDGEGRWKTPPLPRLDHVYMRFMHADYVSDTDFGQTATPELGELRNLTAKTVMYRGVDVSGRVVDPADKPVADAALFLGHVHPDAGKDLTPGAIVMDVVIRPGKIVPVGKTDAEGKFAIKNTRSGEAQIYVEAKGFAPRGEALQFASKMGEVEIKLQTPRVLRLRAVDVEGKGLAGADVSVQSPEFARPYRGKADDEGHFSWDGAPPSKVRVMIAHKRLMMYSDVFMPGEEEREAKLLPLWHIQVKVTDAATGKAITTAMVYMGNVLTNGEIQWVPCASQTLAKTGEMDFSAIPADAAHIRVEAPGYQHVDSTVAHESNEQDFEVKLKKQ